MDRFIELKCSLPALRKTILKSNMDRFIDQPESDLAPPYQFLKSNMDRFIELLIVQIQL